VVEEDVRGMSSERALIGGGRCGEEGDLFEDRGEVEGGRGKDQTDGSRCERWTRNKLDDGWPGEGRKLRLGWSKRQPKVNGEFKSP
jgi:hypothetical protein